MQTKICCARCTKPIEGEPLPVGKFKYGVCCIDKVKTGDKS